MGINDSTGWCAALVALALALVPSWAEAGISDERGLAWSSHRDLTSAQFGEHFQRLSGRNMMMVDVEAYPVGRETRYAMVWRENRDGRGWAQYRDMTSRRFGERWEEFRARGWRPVDIEVYSTSNGLRYAGIWIENREGLRWSSRRGMTGERYGEYFQEQRAAGYRLIDMEVYDTPDGLRYAAIWVENRDNTRWLQTRGMTRESYQRYVDQRAEQGLWVVDFEAYRTSAGMRYAAIWQELPQGTGYQLRTDRTGLEFANLWREYRDRGYRLVDFERYSTPRGDRYAGIWIENAARMRYQRRAQIDSAIKEYREDHAIPGISVAVMHRGQMIYRRGFGHADEAAGRVAHSGTVYGLASVSKAIGGTLAVRLEERPPLAGNLAPPRLIGIGPGGPRRPVELNGLTRGYLPDLPDHHTHTLEQLTAHLGCVVHYCGSTEPCVADMGDHFQSQRDAARRIWDTGLVTAPNCTVGVDRVYSTHAFTLLGAALEQATGRSIQQLLSREITEPLGLDSMRVQFAASAPRPDYERSVPYRDNGSAGQQRNNSWKILGGGIESNVVDLVRFGYSVLQGDVVRPDTRDDRLWAPVREGCTDTRGACTGGIGWALGQVGGRRVAQHGGSASGARSHLRVYRDDDLVIGILSNRRNAHDPATLATTIGEIVLSD